MKKRFNGFIKNENGGAILTIGLMFVIAAMIVLIWGLFQVFGLMNSVENAMENAVYNVIVDNYNEIYDGAKSDIFIDTTYDEDSGGFISNFDYSTVNDQLQYMLGLEQTEALTYCKTDYFCLSNISVEIENGNSSVYGYNSRRFNTTITGDLTIYPSVYGIVYPVTISLERTANFTPKYFNE